MDPLQGAMYALVIKLVDVLATPAVAKVAVPALTLMFLMRFLRWTHAVSRGETEEGLREEWGDSTSTAAARVQRAMGQESSYESRGLYQRSYPRRGRRPRW